MDGWKVPAEHRSLQKSNGWMTPPPTLSAPPYMLPTPPFPAKNRRFAPVVSLNQTNPNFRLNTGASRRFFELNFGSISDPFLGEKTAPFGGRFEPKHKEFKAFWHRWGTRMAPLWVPKLSPFREPFWGPLAILCRQPAGPPRS